MELRHFRYFVAVAEELHFARAAARVGIEQSPLSKAITDMERQLGVRLFMRTRRSTQLTYVGEALLPDARRILLEVEQAQRNVRAAALGRCGRLRVAICDGLAHARIARLLMQVRTEDPQVDIKITHNALPIQLHELCTGLLDVAFSQSARDDQQLVSVPVWKDDAALVMRPEYALATQSSASEIGTEAGPLIVLGERACAEPPDLWRAALGPLAESMEYVLSIELLLTLVAAGYGVGLIGASQAETIHRTDLVIRSLKIQGPTITTFIIRRRGDQSAALSRFIERAHGIP